MPARLKPCPFCGNEATLIGESLPVGIDLRIECATCNTSFFDRFETDPDAYQKIVDQWNHRPEPDHHPG